ncbi:MAG: hypothetical protein UT41_C0007G0005 [Candidatus Wolfebacteria bacterium GW2011_GWC2_39_22]|uniref:Uncharacterized protein n=1 Tax=Candidatus Wolfebacteria bacterium GW2011_GWC2_39_22 TaxID=1619013 RepID=A0A0G0RDI1_9BACT|nr:MAG: hypothetical protein UT41_C0007G0005 [Candidatus Wolfebacteria bacterium GW2011_GWC2_39_22]
MKVKDLINKLQKLEFDDKAEISIQTTTKEYKNFLTSLTDDGQCILFCREIKQGKQR